MKWWPLFESNQVHWPWFDYIYACCCKVHDNCSILFFIIRPTCHNKLLKYLVLKSVLANRTHYSQVTEKALSKKCKNQSCRDALPAKNTSPKTTKQATMHTGRRAQTTHTSQRDAFTAYLPSLHLSNHTSPMISM